MESVSKFEAEWLISVSAFIVLLARKQLPNRYYSTEANVRYKVNKCSFLFSDLDFLNPTER